MKILEKKSERMLTIVSMIEHPTLADIGTDHGYIPILAVTSGKAEQAIGCDIMPKPLSVAEKNIKAYQLEDKITLRLGDGLDPLAQEEVETITITGMGGNTMVEILTAGEKVARSAKQLILSPQSSVPKVRQLVHHFGFIIKNEQMITENKRYYHLINCTVGQESYTEKEYLLGKWLVKEKSDVFMAYIRQEIQHLEHILSKPIDPHKRHQLETLINLYKGI